MTSLIDIIFLLLLFFMLSSTFSRFAEVDLHTGGAAGASGPAPERVLFLRLTAEGAQLNGQLVPVQNLTARLTAEDSPTVLIAVAPDATAQMLTDVIVAVSAVPDLAFSVLEGS